MALGLSHPSSINPFCPTNCHLEPCTQGEGASHRPHPPTMSVHFSPCWFWEISKKYVWKTYRMLHQIYMCSYLIEVVFAHLLSSRIICESENHNHKSSSPASEFSSAKHKAWLCFSAAKNWRKATQTSLLLDLPWFEWIWQEKIWFDEQKIWYDL